MPKISILTPAYIDTPEKLGWFREMLLSLQSQHFTDWEAIVIDDYSPLSLDSLEAEFPLFRWLRTSQNSGPSLCRNTAASLAQSESLLAVDADDVLADDNVLGNLYGAWEVNKSRVVYGDLQRLENGQRSKIFNLAEYTFQRSLDFNGIMPVTALHSKEAHVKAGGWKAELSAGLEDVEYWIACGKAGFCGHRIHGTTLLYRRHETSRSFNLRMVNQRETEMRNKILELHRDVYEGRYPMGCCGGSATYTPPPSNGGQQMSISTPLTEFQDALKQWVQYMGQREGAFGIVGKFTGIHYTVNGPGHKFEVHVNDLPDFRRAGRGRDFAVGVAGPVTLTPVLVEVPAPTQNGRYTPPEPALASIVSTQEPVKAETATYDLSFLELGEKVQKMLEDESWTIEKLAEANMEDLMAYPGVGPVVAERIVQKASIFLRES